MTNNFFVEVDYHQACKHREPVAGDVFLSKKHKEQNRIVTVLADGLGSGVKASVLATLTSTLALKFVSSNTDIKEAANVIMSMLPVCSERKIGYSTFTIVDIEASGETRIIEHDNPPYLAIHCGVPIQCSKKAVNLNPVPGTVHERCLEFSRFRAEYGDRIVFFSDGVNQSGMGRVATPLGWGLAAVQEFVVRQIRTNPHISARDLARRVVEAAKAKDGNKAKDDISCGVVYFRRPRQLLVVTGPPFSQKNDSLMAERLGDFTGKTVVSGGTTASIIARELNREILVNLSQLDPEIPPTSTMQGVDLVTEGTITLAKVAEMLGQNANPEKRTQNGATQLISHLLNSDIIHFLVGTRINEAHQDPNVPVELDLRRHIVKKIITHLEEDHLKETHLEFI